MAKKTNCVINGKPYYRIRATVGHKEDGSPIIKPFYGDCKTEAEKKRDEYLNGIKSGLAVDADKTTIGQFLRYWMYEVKRVDNKLKESSFNRYETAYRTHIKDRAFTTVTMASVNSTHIQRYLNELYKEKKTYYQIKETFKVIKMFFIFAENEGYIIKNPCKNVKIPGDKPAKEPIIVYTDDEIEKIVTALEDNRLRFLILLALGTGMRRGELLALSYDDIENGIIHVKSNQTYVTHIGEDGSRSNETLVGTPKSETSVRMIPLPTSLIKELELHKARQAKERLSLGLGKPDRLFTTITGKPIEKSNLYRAYKRILKKADVEYKKFHCLRHTYATHLVANGVDVKTIQELMGHSDIAITMLYLHPDTNSKRKAAESLNELFVSNTI